MTNSNNNAKSALIVVLIPAVAALLVFTALFYFVKLALATRKGQEVKIAVEAKRVQVARRCYTQIKSFSDYVNQTHGKLSLQAASANLQALAWLENTCDGFLAILPSKHII